MALAEGLLAKTNDEEFVAKSLTQLRLQKYFFIFIKVRFVMLHYV